VIKMKSKILAFIISFFSITGILNAGGVEPYIFNLPKAETYGGGIIMLDVGHRYFDAEKHTTNVNVSLGYGIFNSLDINLAHAFKNDDFITSLKYSFLRDDTPADNPISMAIAAGAGYKPDREDVIEDKYQPSYFFQILLQKHLFKNRFSLGVLPIFAYNTNFYGIESDYDFSSGAGFFAQVYFTDRFSLCGEVIMNVYGFAFKYMNYNAGIKYVGYRHTFSLWLSNNAGYSPVEYITGSITLEPRLSFAFTREFDI